MSLHPSILVQETIDKFGYNPKSLLPKSNKLVVCKCPKCSSVRSIQALRLHGSKFTGTCRKCINYVKRTEISLTDTAYVDMFYSISVSSALPARLLGKGVYVSVENTERVFLSLGLDLSKRILNSEFKSSLLHKISTLPKNRLARVIDYIFEGYRGLRNAGENRPTPYWTVFDHTGLISKCLDSMDFKYTELKNSLLNVTYGSFYINGEWIHIG